MFNESYWKILFIKKKLKNKLIRTTNILFQHIETRWLKSMIVEKRGGA